MSDLIDSDELPQGFVSRPVLSDRQLELLKIDALPSPPKDLKEALGECVTAIDFAEHLRRIDYALSLDLPSMGELQDKWLGETIAVYGSGPSAMFSYQEIPKHRLILACNKAHDFLRSLGIIPKFGAMLHPDPWTINYQTPHPDTTYLLGAQVHPDTFRKFREAGIKPYLFLPIMESAEVDIVSEKFPGRSDLLFLGGGETIGLRASFGIAPYLGAAIVECHGFDSCYAPQTDDEPGSLTRRLYAHHKPHIRHSARSVTIKSRTTGDKFTCFTNEHMARQIISFQTLLNQLPQTEVNGRIGQIKLRVFGDGAIPWMAWKDADPFVEHAFPEAMEAKYGKAKHWHYGINKEVDYGE